MMNIVEKRNISVPLLNIESFGTYYKSQGWDNIEQYMQYYIASLDYKVSSFFKTYNKTVYIPILFINDNDIRSIMEHYSNIYFIIRFKYGYGNIHYSNLYHISNFVDFEKIYKNEKNSMETQPIAYGIDFIVTDYKGYDIIINASYPKYDYNNGVNDPCSPSDIEKLISINGEKDSLTFIKENYTRFPSLVSYSIKNSKSNNYAYNFDKFENALNKIDVLYKENKKREEKLETMYSKKTYKLVEN